MKVANPPDWTALQEMLASLASPTTSEKKPGAAKTPEIVRVLRFVDKYSHAPDVEKSRDAMIDLAKEYQLSCAEAARLFVRLQKLGHWYRNQKMFDLYNRPGDPAKELADIAKALKRVSQFSSRILSGSAGPRGHWVMNALTSEAYHWAAERDRNSKKHGDENIWLEVHSHGFQHRVVSHSEAGPVDDYCAHPVTREWLLNNVLFYNLAVKIIRERKRATKAKDPKKPRPQRNLTTAQQVVGVALPELYKHYTGKSYGFSTREGRLDRSGGPKFVAMCHPVMGLKEPSIDTLRTHWRKAKSPE
ncbi:MAG: hypothetical protein KDK75_05150 [Alphaproteobacteria bacterium]|nr:hypothetical protein [Alphaproteobacteria bacterium]